MIEKLLQRLPHEHGYDISTSKEVKVGLKGGFHTGFLLLTCWCGKKKAFPEDNLNIAIADGTEETKAFLKSLGFAEDLR